MRSPRACHDVHAVGHAMPTATGEYCDAVGLGRKVGAETAPKPVIIQVDRPQAGVQLAMTGKDQQINHDLFSFPSCLSLGHRDRGGWFSRVVLPLSAAQRLRRERARSDAARSLRSRTTRACCRTASFFRVSANSLIVAAAAAALRDPDRRAVRVLRRAAADRRQAGSARARGPAAGAAVLRQRLRAGFDVRPRRRRDRRCCARSASRSIRSTALKGIVTTYTLTLYPFVVLPTVAAFKSVDISVEEAAHNLGAARARMLRTVTLPLVLPSILAGGLLVFIEALENFGVPFVLAEDRPILSVEAYKLFVGETAANPSSAGVLGVLLDRVHGRGVDDPTRRAGARAITPPARAARRRCSRFRRRCAGWVRHIAGPWSPPRWCRSPPWF